MKSIRDFEKKARPEKVIQFGEGGFLRGFVDWILKKLEEKDLFDGSVVVVQPIERGLCDRVMRIVRGAYRQKIDAPSLPSYQELPIGICPGSIDAEISGRGEIGGSISRKIARNNIGQVERQVS